MCSSPTRWRWATPPPRWPRPGRWTRSRAWAWTSCPRACGPCSTTKASGTCPSTASTPARSGARWQRARSVRLTGRIWPRRRRRPTPCTSCTSTPPLVTKAHAHAAVPTLTCTSSNVVQTVLQAFAQIPELRLWYGPDTYMGQNLYSMFQKIAAMSDAEIARLHPAHNRATVDALLGQFEFFKQGMCVVHHMFGEAVTADVRAHYADSYHTAHLEVPGEMFELALEAQQAGNGVIGSTSNILNFITDKTKEALAGGGGGGRPLSFVLGTEAGMVTSIVQGVQAALRGAGGGAARGREELGVEIVFPVAAEAVA
ncbi:unnamed protein product, partial [Heterosigma akashiwo]